ncbi:MAG: hypothetical protein AAGG81_09290, partial [Chlamydiota bacterium]
FKTVVNHPLENSLTDSMQPILKRFFAFTDKEWNHFCELMNKKPLSEKNFQLIDLPKYGCWSGIFLKMQEIIKLCHPVSSIEFLNDRRFETRYMVIPSFSMLQSTIEVKANTLGVTPKKLIPTYYRLDPDDYAITKEKVGMPLGLYFPEINTSLRYSIDNTNFKGTIDEWEDEGPFASILHDFYHALRELAMDDNLFKVRFHLASLAKHHPLNQKSPGEREISDILIDGELIYSHPLSEDTVFNARPEFTQNFRDLFYCTALVNKLHPDLKRHFIRDMVFNQNFWDREFNLSKKDLRQKDKIIYEEVASFRNTKF